MTPPLDFEDYGRLARALIAVSCFGEHGADVPLQMGNYIADEISYDRIHGLEMENLRYVSDTIAGLIRWREAEDRKAHIQAVADARALLASLDGDGA